jgi:SAM-dependent methyltransferase
VLGVDCLPEAIDQLRQRGFDAVCADVQTMDLGRTFDVIVAGDLIEHLSNPGLFLARVKAHLAAGGVFLVTTPNPVTFLRFLRALVSGKTHANKQHTCWFSSKVLCHLASRYGFEVADESYVDDTRFSYRIVRRAPGPEGKRGLLRTVGFVLRRLAWQPAVLIGSLLCLLRPRLAETLCLALKLGQH